MADTLARSAGIDIAKAHLDVHLLPDGIDRQFSNDVQGLRALLRWLPPLPSSASSSRRPAPITGGSSACWGRLACRWSR